MKKLMIMLILGAFPFLSQAEDLHEAVAGKISSDHASEMKSGDFNRHRQSQKAQAGNRKKSAGVASTSAKTRKLAHAGAVSHHKKEAKRPVH